MENQPNELSKGEKASSSPHKYKLRSKKKKGKLDILDHPTRVENPAKDVADNIKEKKAQNPPPVVKIPVPEVKDILKLHSSFIFKNEIQNIRIPVPFVELIKNAEFK
jgi:hypothetical protein